MRWAHRYGQHFKVHDPAFFAALLNTLLCGIRLCTDYSGMGCAEMALANIIAGMGGDFPNVFCHRASDILPHARALLLSHTGVAAPRHVFGDLFDRIPTAAFKEMQTAQRKISKKVRQAWQTHTEFKARAICRALGLELCAECERIMSQPCHAISRTRKAWCYKHNRCCCVSGSSSDSAGIITILVAGVTCTDYSSMGSGLHNTGATVLAFYAFAYQILADLPEIVILECTVLFDTTVLRIFSDEYVIQVIDFSPRELGVPSSRPRKYMLLTRTSKIRLHLPFDRFHFGKLFFARRTASSQLYIVVSDEFRQEGLINSLRKQRGYLKLLDGRPWTLRQVLAPGMFSRLNGYRTLAAEVGEEDGFVNIGQSPDFMKTIYPVVPTLLQGSVVYSMAREKVFEYPEHLLVMGISSAFVGVEAVAEFPGTMLPDRVVLGSVSISARQVRMLCGNGMHLAAVGSCLMFALSH